MTFLEIKGKYICPDCGAVHEIDEKFNHDDGDYDNGISIECGVCGLEVSLVVGFNDDLFEDCDES